MTMMQTKSKDGTTIAYEKPGTGLRWCSPAEQTTSITTRRTVSSGGDDLDRDALAPRDDFEDDAHVVGDERIPRIDEADAEGLARQIERGLEVKRVRLVVDRPPE